MHASCILDCTCYVSIMHLGDVLCESKQGLGRASATLYPASTPYPASTLRPALAGEREQGRTLHGGARGDHGRAGGQPARGAAAALHAGLLSQIHPLPQGMLAGLLVLLSVSSTSHTLQQKAQALCGNAGPGRLTGTCSCHDCKVCLHPAVAHMV